MIGSNCPPSDFDLGLGVGLFALEVAPTQKKVSLSRYTSITATLPLGNGFLRYISRIRWASSRKYSQIRFSSQVCSDNNHDTARYSILCRCIQ